MGGACVDVADLTGYSAAVGARSLYDLVADSEVWVVDLSPTETLFAQACLV